MTKTNYTIPIMLPHYHMPGGMHKPTQSGKSGKGPHVLSSTVSTNSFYNMLTHTYAVTSFTIKSSLVTN